MKAGIKRIQKLAVVLILSGLASCNSIHEDLQECGIYLEFIYDHNMEYTDSFDPHVAGVEVFVFDTEGKYLFSRSATRDRLINNKQMFIAENLPFGTYRILTIGGLSEEFLLLDENGNELTPGVTTVEQVILALRHDTNVYSDSFSPVWFGKVIEINYTADPVVYPVHLIKNTNRFTLTFAKMGDTENFEPDETARYTFEIHTPENAVYSWENAPVDPTPLVYTPYSLLPGTGEDYLTTGYINTCRLFDAEAYDYRIKVLDVGTNREIWSYDLMLLLARTKPPRPGGSELPLQEYLDRQSEWNLTIIYKGGDGEIGFIAVGVIINGWIMWLKDIEV